MDHWYTHQNRKHFPQLVYCCGKTLEKETCKYLYHPCKRKDGFKKHLIKCHGLVSGDVLDQEIIRRTCQTRNMFHDVCGFCSQSLSSWKESMDHIGNHIERYELVGNWRHQCSKPEHKLRAQEAFDIFPENSSSDDESGDDETDDEAPRDGNECAPSDGHDLPDVDLDFNFDFHDHSTATPGPGWGSQRFSGVVASSPQRFKSTHELIVSRTSRQHQQSDSGSRLRRRWFVRWLQRQFGQKIPGIEGWLRGHRKVSELEVEVPRRMEVDYLLDRMERVRL